MSKEKEKIYDIGDCRISSQKQQEGASLEDQEIQITAFAKESGNCSEFSVRFFQVKQKSVMTLMRL